jgi:peptidoglycan/xylan/chitin deacetylase (PgdA/CDA1 family)
LARLPLVLCYHKVDRRRELGVTRISPRRFAKQIERFAAAGYRALTLGEFAACVRGTRAAAANEILITFDDAYRALRDYAFPVLEAHGFPATCFVITAYAGKLNRWDVAYGGRRFAHLAWRDMRKWQGRGITFASHTATHPRLTWLTDRDVGLELDDSRRDIQAALDSPTCTISYPFGAHGAREQSLARALGYELGFTLAGSWNGSSLALPRLPVYVWSPRIPGVSNLRALERVSATIANRASVGTVLWRSLRTRLSANVTLE